MLQSTEGLHVIDMADHGAPLIKRYFECNYSEGYLYVMIKNEDPEAVYKEILEFDKFDKLEMCEPYRGQRFEITIGPG